MSDRCATRYPVVLIHGAGFRDLRWPVYWGRIPAALQAEGAQLYYGLQDCWGSIETNAGQIARRIDEILAETGAQKVNVIAHSKGGTSGGRPADTAAPTKSPASRRWPRPITAQKRSTGSSSCLAAPGIWRPLR